MDYLETITTYILIGIALLPFGLFFLYPILFLIPLKYPKLLFNRSLWRFKKQIPTILQHDRYYIHLNEKEKIRFQKRVFEFLIYKNFERINENDPEALVKLDITDEMRIKVASTAVKVTFGHNSEYEYKSFSRIIISGKDYLSHITQKIHKGETNPNAGYIAISWGSYQEGERFEHDCVNVGYHEFAHAAFSDEVCGNSNLEFLDNIGEWHQTVSYLCKKEETHAYLRKYAFTNKMEFFAVSVEYFFEDPKGFIEHLPDLYMLMVKLLNQNPLLPNNGLVRNLF